MKRVFLWSDENGKSNGVSPFDIFAKNVYFGCSVFGRRTVFEKGKENAEIVSEQFEAKLSDCFEKRFKDSKAVWFINEGGDLCCRETYSDGRLDLCTYRLWDNNRSEEDLWTLRDFVYRGHYCDGLLNFFTKPLGPICMEAFQKDLEAMPA